MKNDARHFACNPDARQDWQARLHPGFDRDAHGTRLADRRHTGPLRVQKALYPESPAVCHAVIVHPPGGVVGGDALRIAISAADGAQALLTTPGAGKWYRANGRASRQHVRVDVGENAALEWLPQETLLYRDTQVEMTHDVSLAANACHACRLPAARFDPDRIGWRQPGRDLQPGAVAPGNRCDRRGRRRKYPRKGGPGITRSDLLVINKTDLAPIWSTNLEVIRVDAARMRGTRPFVFASLRHGVGVDDILAFIRHQGLLDAVPSSI